MYRLFCLAVVLPACDHVFGPSDGGVTVAIERPAEAAEDRSRAPAGADAHEVSRRVWALLQLGQLADAEEQCARAEASAPEGEPRHRALLLYRCGRVAEARRDATARARRLRAAIELQPSARVDRELRGEPAPVPLPDETMEAVRRRLREIGARKAPGFRLVDGPIEVGPNRAVSFEACAAPSEVCQGALVTLGPDGRPVDAFLVNDHGLVPGSLQLLSIPGSTARVVTLRGDLPAQLHEALFVAVRVDAGRMTPVAFVHASEAHPDRAVRVRVDGDALMIDERRAPWDARLRLFRGAPVAASPP